MMSHTLYHTYVITVMEGIAVGDFSTIEGLAIGVKAGYVDVYVFSQGLRRKRPPGNI